MRSRFPQVTSVLGLPSSIVESGLISTRSRLPQVTSVLGLPSSIVEPGVIPTRSRLPQVTSVLGLPSSIVEPGVVSTSCIYQYHYTASSPRCRWKTAYLRLSNWESIRQSRQGSDCENNVAHDDIPLVRTVTLGDFECLIEHVERTGSAIIYPRCSSLSHPRETARTFWTRTRESG